MNRQRAVWLLLLGVAILGLDGWTKGLTVAHLPLMAESSPYYPYGGIGLVRNFLGVEISLSHTTNLGAAWGAFGNFQTLLLWVRVGLILGVVAYLLRAEPYLQIPLVMIISGAVGNVADYFVYGHVVDMIHFVLWGYDFPVFNVADSSITVGVGVILLFSLVRKEVSVGS